MMLSDFIRIDDYTDEEIEDYGVMTNSMFPGYETVYVRLSGGQDDEVIDSFPCETVLVKMEYEV